MMLYEIASLWGVRFRPKVRVKRNVNIIIYYNISITNSI